MMPKSKILIADDEVIIAMQLKERLTAMGYEVAGIASTGHEAVILAKSTYPDLILMDIVMPGELDGIAAAEMISRQLKIPVVFLTAYTEESVVDRAKQVEPLGYIVKPFHETEVRAAIEVALYKKAMEQCLRASEERYTLAVRAGKVGVWDWNLITDEIYIDPNLKSILGYADDEIRNHMDEWRRHIHPADLGKAVAESDAALKSHKPSSSFEYRMLCKNGSVRWFLCQATVLRDQEDRANRMIGTNLDITQRKQAEVALQQAHDQLEQRVIERTAELLKSNAQLQREIKERNRSEKALRESEEKYRQLFENVSDALMVFNAQLSHLEDANHAALDLFGYTKQDFMALDSTNLLKHPAQKRLILEKATKSFEASHAEPLCYFRKKDGSVFPGEISAGIFFSQGRTKIIGAVRDITHRIQSDKQIRSLTQKLLKAQESERQRVARDLHDNVAQDLSTLKIACETLFDNNPGVTSEIRQNVSRISQQLNHLIQNVRDLAYDLRPSILDQLGLVRAAFQHCKEFSKQTGIKVDFFSAGLNGLRFDFDTEINLYRLIQESLRNISKHAQASQVTIRMVASYPSIILRIEDNGVGFDVKNRQQSAKIEKRMGLQSMQERVSLLNGKMELKSDSMRGTKFFIEVPFKTSTYEETTPFAVRPDDKISN